MGYSKLTKLHFKVVRNSEIKEIKKTRDPVMNSDFLSFDSFVECIISRQC